jgi:hypothetical protein
MLTFLSSLLLSSFLSIIPPVRSTFYYPTPLSSLLEHILVDTHGAHSSPFALAITPCSNYVSGAQTLGRETAAQWVRVAFHDFVTADLEAGTGGIDASIGFETLRAENSGSAMNDSLRFFQPFVNKVVSSKDNFYKLLRACHVPMLIMIVADLIALSVIMVNAPICLIS